MLRRLLHIASRASRPMATLDVGWAGGRFLYVTAGVGHGAAIAVPLVREDVARLAACLDGWLADRAAEEDPFGWAPFKNERPAPATEGPPALAV